MDFNYVKFNYDKFDDWYYEQEGFGLRAERFNEYMDFRTVTPKNKTEMIQWLKSAFEAGREFEKNNG
jgi:hypothetical protein